MVANRRRQFLSTERTPPVTPVSTIVSSMSEITPAASSAPGAST